MTCFLVGSPGFWGGVVFIVRHEYASEHERPGYGVWGSEKPRMERERRGDGDYRDHLQAPHQPCPQPVTVVIKHAEMTNAVLSFIEGLCAVHYT
jgi:hypothetical protein